jgi:hypothetical protein
MKVQVDMVMKELQRFVEDYKKFMDWLNAKHRAQTPSEYSKKFEDIFSVTSETELLREIQDMKDELNMLAAVFSDQQTVLKKAGEDIAEDRKKELQTRSSAFNFQQQSQKHARHIDRMRVQAEQAYSNVSHDTPRMLQMAEFVRVLVEGSPGS